MTSFRQFVPTTVCMHGATGERRRISVIERLLTAHELADRLGFQPGTIVDWYEADKIPGFKLGGKLRFDPTEVDEWLNDHRNGAIPTALSRSEDAGVNSPAALSTSARTASQQRHRPDSTRDLQGGHES